MKVMPKLQKRVLQLVNEANFVKSFNNTIIETLNGTITICIALYSRLLDDIFTTVGREERRLCKEAKFCIP